MSDFIETELGNLPESWLVTTVEDLVQEEVLAKPLDGNHGNIHPKGTDFVSEGIPFIMASDVNNGKVDLVNCKFISQEHADSLQKGFSKTGDVLLTHKASLGRTAIVQENPYPYIMLTPQVTYYRILDSSRLNNKYLKYNFDSPIFQDTLVNHGDSGSTRAYVGITAQRELPVIYPPIEIQSSISQTLGSLDDKIDLLHRQNQTLEQMAETLFRQWFVEEADEGWEEGRLGDFISTNETSINKNYQHQEIKYLDTGSLTKGQWGNLQSLHLVDAPSRAKRLVKHNDILYSTVRPNQLHYGIVRSPIENLVVSTGFCVITCKSISPYFVYYLLTDSGMTEYLHSIAEGSTSAYPSLKPSDLEALEISEPPSDILDKFHCFVDDTWKKVETNYTQIRSLTALRDTLLPKLMSGEVRVKIE